MTLDYTEIDWSARLLPGVGVKREKCLDRTQSEGDNYVGVQ